MSDDVKIATISQKLRTDSATPADVVELHDAYMRRGQEMAATVLRSTRPLDFRAAEAEGLAPMTRDQALDHRQEQTNAAHAAGRAAANAQLVASLRGRNGFDPPRGAA